MNKLSLVLAQKGMLDTARSYKLKYSHSGFSINGKKLNASQEAAIEKYLLEYLGPKPGATQGPTTHEVYRSVDEVPEKYFK